MRPQEAAQRQAEAIEQFNRGENRADGDQVVGSLSAGLNVLRDLLYLRVHQDVEKIVGRDSMWAPISEVKAEDLTKDEIERYQVAESAVAAQDFGYVAADVQWYLQWLARMRLGEAQPDPQTTERLNHYISKTPDERRLAFTDVLAKILPESARAPLILFRLLPPSVQIATALAFGDDATAGQLRKQQNASLPEIAGCRACRGEILENGRQCRECGNPLWKYSWLISVD